MTNDLSILDRATLAAWRAVNEIGWTALAFLLAASGHISLTHWLISRRSIGGITAFDLNTRPGAEEGIDDILAKFGLRIGLTLAIALLIGWLVGRRVWRRQTVLAALAALLYVLYVTISLEGSTSGESVTVFENGTEIRTIMRTTLLPAILYDLIVAATVPFAALWARRIAQRRTKEPAILTDALG